MYKKNGIFLQKLRDLIKIDRAITMTVEQPVSSV